MNATVENKSQIDINKLMKEDRTYPIMTKYDKATQLIWKLFFYMRMPALARIYISSPMMYNYMIVGASGVVLSWLLYECMLRPILATSIGGIGTFLGMCITTICVFLWNFIWNKKWSLNAKYQVLKMSKKEQEELYNLLGAELFNHSCELGFDKVPAKVVKQ